MCSRLAGMLGEGAFGLAFGERHGGRAFSVALDRIKPTDCALKGREPGIRAAPWPDPDAWLGPWEIPEELVSPLDEFVANVSRD